MKIAEGIVRKVEFGRRAICVIAGWGQSQRAHVDAVVGFAENRYRILRFDVWALSASNDSVSALFWRLAEAAGTIPEAKVRKIGRALGYIAAAVISRASGVDFRDVVSGLRFADDFPLNAPDRTRETFNDMIKGAGVPIMVIVERLELVEDSTLCEILYAVRFLVSLECDISILVYVDSESADRNQELLARITDCVVHLPEERGKSSRLSLLKRWVGSTVLSKVEKEALENFIAKAATRPYFRQTSGRKAVRHFVSGVRIIEEITVIRICPFILWMKYQCPRIYSALIRNDADLYSLVSGNSKEDEDCFRLVAAENQALGVDTGTGDSEGFARMHRLVLSLEAMGM